MTDDERFDQWATSRRSEMEYRENVKWAREGWHGGIESERARVREIMAKLGPALHELLELDVDDLRAKLAASEAKVRELSMQAKVEEWHRKFGTTGGCRD